MFDDASESSDHSLGINQVEFGKRLNVTKQCISNWENNNIMPSIDMLIRISKTFRSVPIICSGWKTDRRWT